MKLSFSKRNIINLLPTILLCLLCKHSVADSNFEIKKLIFSDCTKAVQAVSDLTPESKVLLVDFLQSVLSNSTALQQPMLPSPNISSPFTDEPKVGELVAINSIERDSQAKKCALIIAPMLFPQSLNLIPSIIPAAVNKDLPKDIRDLIAQSSSKWSAKILDKTQRDTVLKSAIDAFIKDQSNPAAQNVIIELSSDNLELFFSSFVNLTHQIDSNKFANLVSIIDPSNKQSIEHIKKMALEGGNTRSLGISLIKTVPSDILKSDIEWSKKIASLVLDSSYRQLIEDINFFDSPDTQETLVSLLKGAAPEDKDTILTILAKYKSLLPISEEQLLKRAFSSDSVTNAAIRETLLNVANRHSSDLVERKKWSSYISNVFNFYLTSQETVPNNVISTFVNYYPELHEVIKSTWPGKKTDDKKWLKSYLEWSQTIGGPNFTKASVSFLSTFWKDLPPVWMQEIFKAKFLDLIKANSWQLNKSFLTTIKTSFLNKSSTAEEKIFGLKLLHQIDPKKLSKPEAKELLSATDCTMIPNELLFSASGISTDDYFGIFLGCYQRGLIDRSQVIQFFLSSKLSIDDRQKLFMASIDNLLYDRVFRANLLSVSGALQASLTSLSKTIQELLKDADPLVQFETLESLSMHNIEQLQPVLPILKAFMESSQNIADNRALATVVYLKSTLEDPTTQSELLQSLFSSAPLAKALIEQYQNLPSAIYVQALSNRLPDLEPGVKIQALESLLSATEPVLLDGLDSEILIKLKDSKVETVKELAQVATILKLSAAGTQVEDLLSSVLYTNARWKLLKSPLRSRIPPSVVSKLKTELCPLGRTACLTLDKVN